MRQRRLDEAERWLGAARGDGADGGDGVDGVDGEDGPHPFDEGEERILQALQDIAAIRADPERMPPAEWADRLEGLRARADEGGPDAWFAYADALDRLYRLPEAAEWYRKAGTPRALLALGRMLYEGGGAKGVRMVPYYEPAAAEGDAGAAYDIGRIHDEAGDRRTAQIWFRRAADLGHGRAAWWLGWTSEERGGDPQHAERWYVRAARSGLVPPAFLAGRSMVRRGACAEAEPLLRVACEGEHQEAPYWLAQPCGGLGGRRRRSDGCGSRPRRTPTSCTSTAKWPAQPYETLGSGSLWAIVPQGGTGGHKPATGPHPETKPRPGAG
ncbi:tetratricopeptide repeat protein [Streptomyces malaysiensis subsp. malaysiensis]